MFGYLVADLSGLPEDRLLRYKSVYCGLCRTLAERFGQPARLTLNYDLTFLAVFLESLYEPEESSGENGCIMHPFKKRAWHVSEATEYAADMNIALAYLKCLDDWHDDGSLAALAESALLKAEYGRIKAARPLQCGIIEESISELSELEKSGSEDADACAACFGKFMGAVFNWKDDRWSADVTAFGDSLGRFIYLMDACMDLDGDAVKNSFNPFRRYYGLDNEARFRQILKLFLSDALRSFSYLPIVQDADILKNIMCVGLWQAFDRKFSSPKGTADGSGSV